MITGEDYNISPLSVTQLVAKIKSVNRTSSGISRYFDLKDPTGKYSSTNLFADDGIIYEEPYSGTSTFSYITKTDIEGIIYNQIFQLLDSPDLRNFYYANYINYITASLNISWYNYTSDSNSSTGYVGSAIDATPYKVSSYTTTDLKYFVTGSLVKFTAPNVNGTQYYFDTNNANKLVSATVPSVGLVNYLWAQVVSITGDGTTVGSITLNKIVPNLKLSNGTFITPTISQIIPDLSVRIGSSVITTMIDLIFSNKPFGLRYDATTQTWQIIFETNLNTTNTFSLANAGDTTNQQLDSSWILLFTTNNQIYTVSSRLLRYVFESDKEISFYFDSNLKIYDTVSSSTIVDSLKILSINTHPTSPSDTLGIYPFTTDLSWQITSEYVGLDGYVDPKKIVVTFADSENNGIVDNPQLFVDIVAPNYSPLTKYVVQEKYLISQGQEDYRYVFNDPANPVVVILATDPGVYSSYSDGQYFYFADTQVVKKYNASTSTVIPSLDYKVYVGRDKLKFQYIHNADYDSRIDPGASNIMDIYVLTISYDTQFRQWLAGANVTQPLPPSSAELNSILSPSLNLIKSISDEIIYHPVSYILLFGAQADLNLQATFNVVKNPNSTASDNDIISRILLAFDKFFALDNWNFGDTFYFAELSTYVLNQLTPDVTNFVIVPKQNSLYFGNLFEIKCPSNQIFVSCAQASDIVIVSGFTSDNLKTISGTSLNNIIVSQNITTATFGVTNG
jgi:hypothetical protein